MHKLVEKAEEDFLMIILPRIIKECDTIEVAKEKALASCKRLCLPTDGLDDQVEEFLQEYWSDYKE